MKVPDTYLDRAGRKNNQYVFISYSHQEKEQVYPMLEELFQAGINFWYDKELRHGDVWNEEVRGILNAPECVGAIFFLTDHIASSDAISQEIQAANECAKNREFAILPVLIDFSTYENLMHRVLESNISHITDFAALTKDGARIMLMNDGKVTDSLIGDCEQIGASEKNYIEIRGTRYSVLDGERVHYHKLGSYPNNPSGIKAPILWRLVSRRGNVLKFVSQYCLDFVEYKSACFISRAAFGLDDRKEVLSLDLIDSATIAENGDTIGRAIATDYADFKRSQSFRAFWVRGEDGNLLLYNTMNKDVGEVPDPENDIFTAGIRLVMELDDDQIKTEG